jgi:GTPase SAR1 family protein
MKKFPTPPPDRRIQKKASYPKLHSNEEDLKSIASGISNNNIRKSYPAQFITSGNNNMNFTMGGLNTNSNSVGQIYLFSEPNEKDDYEKYNNLNLLKMKHIEDMRNSILDYKLLRDKKMYLPSNISNINVTKSNIILFGPSGSGKSSFIKSLYRALYGTPFLPPDALNKLIVQGPYQNEGTLCFTRLHLKEEGDNSSGIVVSDTRGHIRMNDAEKEQFKVILEGKVKEDVKIVQKPKRDPMQLWEFWKKDTELFPKEIFNAQEPGLDSLPHIILLVFNGSEDEVIDTEDEKFYKDLIDMSYKKGIFIHNWVNIF